MRNFKSWTRCEGLTYVNLMVWSTPNSSRINPIGVLLLKPSDSVTFVNLFFMFRSLKYSTSSSKEKPSGRVCTAANIDFLWKIHSWKQTMHNLGNWKMLHLFELNVPEIPITNLSNKIFEFWNLNLNKLWAKTAIIGTRKPITMTPNDVNSVAYIKEHYKVT